MHLQRPFSFSPLALGKELSQKACYLRFFWDWFQVPFIHLLFWMIYIWLIFWGNVSLEWSLATCLFPSRDHLVSQERMRGRPEGSGLQIPEASSSLVYPSQPSQSIPLFSLNFFEMRFNFLQTNPYKYIPCGQNGMDILLIPFFKWGNCGSERVSNLLKITQLVNSRTGIWN